MADKQSTFPVRLGFIDVNRNMCWRFQVDRCDGSGTVIENILDLTNPSLSPDGTTGSVTVWAQVPTTRTLSDGDRIRVRAYFDDLTLFGNMVSGGSGQFRYDKDSANNGDNYVGFEQTITEYVPPQAYRSTYPQLLAY